jgi:hypothetical protein
MSNVYIKRSCSEKCYEMSMIRENANYVTTRDAMDATTQYEEKLQNAS